MRLPFFKRKSLVTLFEKVQCTVIVLVLTPTYYIFHITIIKQEFVQLYHPGPLKLGIHMFLSTFCFINVIGNMLLAVFTDTSLKNNRRSRGVIKNSKYCEQCKVYQPPRSWHCQKCDVCIVNRNHHCMFIARCVGQYNQRYYLLFMMYFLISISYSTFYDFFLIISKFEDWQSFLFSVIQFFNPVMRLLLNKQEFEANDLYGLFLLMNGVLWMWLLFVVWYHWSNALAGLTHHERHSQEKKKKDRDPMVMPRVQENASSGNWKQNFLRIFGTKWYWAVLIPIADSPIPHFDDESDQAKIA